MTTTVDEAVEAVNDALNEACSPKQMSKADYVEVLETLASDFRERAAVTKSEMEDDDEP